MKLAQKAFTFGRKLEENLGEAQVCHLRWEKTLEKASANLFSHIFKGVSTKSKEGNL